MTCLSSGRASVLLRVVRLWDFPRPCQSCCRKIAMTPPTNGVSWFHPSLFLFILLLETFPSLLSFQNHPRREPLSVVSLQSNLSPRKLGVSTCVVIVVDVREKNRKQMEATKNDLSTVDYCVPKLHMKVMGVFVIRPWRVFGRFPCRA